MDTVVWRSRNVADHPGAARRVPARHERERTDARRPVRLIRAFTPQTSLEEPIDEGDVLLQSDPYLCDGAIQHTPDWLVLVPIDYQGRRIGYTSMFGHMLDVGGSVPGSMAATAELDLGRGHPDPAGQDHRARQAQP